MLDLQKMSYFMAVVEQNFNLSKAAQSLFISQPALSNAIHAIEKEEELTLFVRNNGRYTGLTPCGKYLYGECKFLFRKYNQILEQARRIESDDSETVTIAAPPFLLRSYAAAILLALKDRFPQVEFLFREADEAGLKRGLLKGHFDIGLITEPNDYHSAGLFVVTIDQGRFMAVLENNHPLAGREILEWREIVPYPLAIPGPHFPTYDLIVNSIRSRGLKPKIGIATSGWDFQVSCLLKTDYISLMPEIVRNYFTKEMDEQLKMLPVNHPIAWRVAYCENNHIRKTRTMQEIRAAILAMYNIQCPEN
ncbi:LysR family transcriptional regulator [Mageeibacillus indolicus]|uniref:LysR family transcriptional regulator n=1 Tax=Mageeibacillus indolicus TaxID=884684 RepID=UPI0004DD89F5|nr:LysR family transcriptional regulator [Mageeibacillus indolicus]KFA57950.1 hypothetical protein HMPREF1632_00160 [Mageeibacillus indolicus 0009-5]